MVNTWIALGKSIAGANHKKKGLEGSNQDALGCLPKPGEPFIIAIADGHGGDLHFRSKIGSEIAVTQTIQVLQALLKRVKDSPHAALLAVENATVCLSQDIVESWCNSVDEDIRNCAPENSDWTRVTYGTTVLAVAITNEFVLYLQLGDGDILTVAQNGSVTRPIERNKDLIANATTSLCLDDAALQMKMRVILSKIEQPALILLSTDGYSNSFRTDDDFLKAGSDYLEILQEQGPDYVQDSLDEWLEQTSKEGSGDDITLALLWNFATSHQNIVTNDTQVKSSWNENTSLGVE